MYHDAFEILSVTANGFLMSEKGWMIVAVFFLSIKIITEFPFSKKHFI